MFCVVCSFDFISFVERCSLHFWVTLGFGFESLVFNLLVGCGRVDF